MSADTNPAAAAASILKVKHAASRVFTWFVKNFRFDPRYF